MIAVIIGVVYYDDDGDERRRTPASSGVCAQPLKPLRIANKFACPPFFNSDS
jgi:hypothetical protein